MNELKEAVRVVLNRWDRNKIGVNHGEEDLETAIEDMRKVSTPKAEGEWITCPTCEAMFLKGSASCTCPEGVALSFAPVKPDIEIKCTCMYGGKFPADDCTYPHSTKLKAD